MIKFNQHHVLNTETGAKARVSYSIGNRTDGRACVTIYAKDYGHELADVMPAADYQNDTDISTDYFAHGRVVLFADNPLYPAALATAQLLDAKREARWAAKIAAKFVIPSMPTFH